jgi:hypothetical protein
MYTPKVGDIIFHFGRNMLVIDSKINEDCGSCSYDRSYKVVSHFAVRDRELLDLDAVGEWIDIKGTTFPEFIKVSEVAPFEITKVNYVRLRQKQAKTVIVYD